MKVTQHTYWENGKQLVRTFYETPVGTVSTLVEPVGFTTWRHERMFKRPEDYKVILFLLKDERYEPATRRSPRRSGSSGRTGTSGRRWGWSRCRR